MAAAQPIFCGTAASDDYGQRSAGVPLASGRDRNIVAPHMALRDARV